jgi:hypothetical protein
MPGQLSRIEKTGSFYSELEKLGREKVSLKKNPLNADKLGVEGI